MDDELTPSEEQQPEPSRTRFRDTAREIGKIPSVSAGIIKDNKNREHALKEDELADAINAPGVKNKATAIKDLAKSMPGKTLDAHDDNIARGKNIAKTLGANKKWLLGFGGGLAIVIPIAVFFMWIMLFKNVHIKNLYVTYRWAQFNRGLNKALKGQLEYIKENPEVKPKGTAETTVDPNDSIDDLTKKSPEADISTDKLASDADIEAEANKRTALDKSVTDGANADAIKDAGGNGATPEIKGEGDTEEKRAKSAQEKAGAAAEKDLVDAADITKEAPDSLKSGIEEASKEGKTPEDGATKLLSGGGGWQEVFSKASTGVFVATVYCIIRDLYTTARDELAKSAVNASIIAAQDLNKTADCQKLGKCSATQAGAMAERYDNESGSFMDSCGAARAQQSATTGCEEIDPKYAVNGLVQELNGTNKNLGLALKGTDDLLDPPFAGKFIEPMCSAVMNPITQGVITVAEGFAIISSGGGWAAFGKAAAGGAVAFVGTSGGKALIASTIAKYTGSAYRHITPTQLGNITDMGNLANASAACAKAYCPQVDDATVARLDNDYRTERIAANSKRSVLEKFFDNSSPDSVLSRVAINTPGTPSAMMGQISNFIASISNPIKLNTVIGKNTLALSGSSTAYAYDTNGSVYGLSNKVTMPPNLLDDTPYSVVAKWGKETPVETISALEDKYKICASDSYAARVSSEDTTCYWNSMDSQGKMFMRYKFLQHGAYMGALLHNKQTNRSSSSDTNPSQTQTPTNSEPYKGQSAQDLAKQLLTNPKISFTTPQAKQAVENTANGKKAALNCRNTSITETSLSPVLLYSLQAMTNKYKIGIGYLVNGCHSGGSYHYTGRAVDIGTLNDKQADGNDQLSWDFLQDLSGVVPDGSGFGQKNCGVGSHVNPVNKIKIFNDSCNHIHIQVPE